MTCSTNGEIRNAYEISVRRPEERDHLSNICVYVRIIFKLILKG